MDFYEECKRNVLESARFNQKLAETEALAARMAIDFGMVARAVEFQGKAAYSYRMARKHMERAANVE